MKHYSILAICASVLAASCTVNSITEESYVPENAGNGTVATIIGATIGESRTTLGTPDGKTYPILWQAGDKINVNGTESNALTASDFNGKSAEFAFASEVASPYKAVSPASAVKSFGETTTVIVPFGQEYVAGSFDPAAAVMLGSGDNGVAFVSAMSFLKIRTSGTADIARIEVSTLGTEPMAGEFTTSDFATLAPVEGGNVFPATAVIPDEPVAAGAEFIVAIPAQTYANGIKLTLQDPEGKVMMIKHADSFAAVAGKMYAFDVEFVPAAVEGTITIDGDFADWLAAPAVSYSIPLKNPACTNIIKLSLTADDNFVYGYVEMDETYPGYSTFMDIFVDTDGDPTTGGKLNSVEGFSGVPYSDSGLEWYIEGGTFYGDIFKYGDSFKKYEYGGADGAGIFGGLTEVTSSFSGKDYFKLSGVSNAKGLGRFEFKMDRVRFKFYGSKAALGIKNIINNKAAGLLPQGASTGNDFERIGMGSITMKECSYQPSVAPITIDGQYEDWLKAGIATLTRTNQMYYQYLKTAKFIADPEYLYVYMEVDKPCSFGSNPFLNLMMDFYIDCDGNKATGGTRSSVYDAGFNWYYETGIAYDTDYSIWGNWGSGQYEFTGTDGQGIFDSNQNHGAAKRVNAAGYYDSTNDFVQIEARLNRADFKLVNTKAGVGIVIMDGSESWAVMGMLPQGIATDLNDSKTRQVCELLYIDLPAIAE